MNCKPSKKAKRQNQQHADPKSGLSLDTIDEELKHNCVKDLLFPFPVRERKTCMSVMLAQYSDVVRHIVELKQPGEAYPALDHCGLREEDLEFVNKMMSTKDMDYAEELKGDVEKLKICSFLFKYDIPYKNVYEYFVRLVYNPKCDIKHGELYSCTDVSFLCEEDPIIYQIADGFVKHICGLQQMYRLSQSKIQIQVPKFRHSVLETLVWKKLALSMFSAQ